MPLTKTANLAYYCGFKVSKKCLNIFWTSDCLNPTRIRYLLAGEHPQDGHSPD
ncbi:MAG: hypothetical protein LBC64_11700 [Fibromonadaceae bacterium]|nr:hypothetical protein [Fibromonadaceae bacterium]